MARTETAALNDDVAAAMATLQLRGVFLGGASIDVSRDVSPSREEKEINVRLEHQVRLDEADNVLRAITSFKVEGHRLRTKKPFVRVKGTFDVLFERPSIAFTEDAAAEVAKVATMVVWPYVRELVASLAMRAGVAVPLPPLMKVSELQAQEE
ncbi:MAG: hypothetical protein QMD96_06860 [Anaerosomatales bacterium]|nr:hypothetical protein [Anaerosomatales bacterium]